MGSNVTCTGRIFLLRTCGFCQEKLQNIENFH